MHRTDLCDERFLNHLFAAHKFTDVVHMAAQAGVSQSLLNPLVYVQANIACLTTLLDVLTDYKVRNSLARFEPLSMICCNFRTLY